MNPRHYRDMIIRAVGEADGKTLDLIVSHVIDAENAKGFLRANGYGVAGLSASATARLVPPAPPGPPTRVVTIGLNPRKQDAHNRRHHIGAYEPAYMRAVSEWNARYEIDTGVTAGLAPQALPTERNL